jgi:alpha,alpha-trehalose phosphorylase
MKAGEARAHPAVRGRRLRIVERRFDGERMGAQESVFAVGNGYLGIRGGPEEGAPAHDAGVNLNGFHETWPIVYPEDAYGLARTRQTNVGVTDGSLVSPRSTTRWKRSR